MLAPSGREIKPQPEHGFNAEDAEIGKAEEIEEEVEVVEVEAEEEAKEEVMEGVEEEANGTRKNPQR